MSATCVVPLSDLRQAGTVAGPATRSSPKAPPPLPCVVSSRAEAHAPTSSPRAEAHVSMRVPKGTLAHGQHEDNDDWESLVAQAKARADDEWEAAVSAAKARAERVQQDEERAWQEALARAKRIAQLESSGEARVARQPARPPVRVPRRGAQGAFGPPRVVMAPGQRAVAATAGTPSVNAGSVPGAAVYGGAAALDQPGALLICSRAEPRASTEAADDVEWRLLRQRAEQRAQQERALPRMVLDAAQPYSIFTPAPRPVCAPRVVAWP